MLVEKTFEPLDAMLKAYDARIKSNQTKENRWMTELEKLRFEMCQKLIQTAQALMEPSPAMSIHERIKPKPSINPLVKNVEERENVSLEIENKNKKEENSQETKEKTPSFYNGHPSNSNLSFSR